MAQQSGNFDSSKERNVHSTERTGSLETAHLARKARREDFRNLQQLFDIVVRAYIENRAMPFVIALNADEDAEARSHKHTANSSLWAVDCELATEAALRDRDDLQRAWFDLALGKPVKPDIAVQVITRCGRLYRARGIEPSAWHRPSAKRARYGRTAN